MERMKTRRSFLTLTAAGGAGIAAACVLQEKHDDALQKLDDVQKVLTPDGCLVEIDASKTRPVEMHANPLSEARKPMPNFGQLLTDEQRWHIVNCVRTLANKPAAAK